MANSQFSPYATYQRGETLDVKWVLNNHRGGFVRLGFVPVEAMWNKQAHKRLAQFYGCWDFDLEPCSGERWCGTDKGSESIHKVITVPTCLPDGDYVFSYAWFGGLHYSKTKGHFPDFHHCSHVRISGGVFGTCQAVFEPGDGPSVSLDGLMCHTSATDVGQCGLTGCRSPGSSLFAVPDVFQGAGPPEFDVGDVQFVRDNPDSDLSTWPIAGNSDPGVPDGGSGVPDGGGGGGALYNCAGGVCCSPGCRQCAQSRRCRFDSVLSTDECCKKAIIRSGRVCGRDAPPCMCENGKQNNCPVGAMTPGAGDDEAPDSLPPPLVPNVVPDVLPDVLPGGTPDFTGVICSGGVCCSRGCRACAGSSKCQLDKSVPTDECCRNSVVRTGRDCRIHGPPCMCEGLRPSFCPN